MKLVHVFTNVLPRIDTLPGPRLIPKLIECKRQRSFSCSILEILYFSRVTHTHKKNPTNTSQDKENGEEKEANARDNIFHYLTLY